MEIEERAEHEGRVRALVMNRPTKKNALTVTMYRALAGALDAAAASPDVRAVTLRGAGDAFTAGNDIGDFVTRPPLNDHGPVLELVASLVRFPKPLVAIVHGPAMGFGTTMLMHCDLVLASPSARFQLPFARLGLCPEGGSSVLLPDLAGAQRASELLLWADPFDAAAAHAWGLVNEIVPEPSLRARAAARLERLLALPPQAIAATKALLRASTRAALEEALSREAPLFSERLASDDAAAAFSAFFAKKSARSS